MNMRSVWIDHVVWTRNVIFCLVDGLPGTDKAVERLLQNQDDIGNIFKPYYGEVESKKLTKLLYEHINISAEVIKADISGHTTKFIDARKLWYANSDKMAEFFYSQDPAWPLADLKTMMALHLDLTITEAENRIKKDYTADVSGFEKTEVEISKMADMFADGIIKQNPTRFVQLSDLQATESNK